VAEIVLLADRPTDFGTILVSDVSSTTSITVADVSSTSSDIVIAPLNERKQEEDDDDDEPPVIIDVMINTSHNQYLIPR
jgi:hypothetical protein